MTAKYTCSIKVHISIICSNFSKILFPIMLALIMLNAFSDLLCSKLCCHNQLVPTPEHSWTSDRPQQKQTYQHLAVVYWQLVYWWSYPLMVKTVLWHGVRKWRVLAKQVTIMEYSYSYVIMTMSTKPSMSACFTYIAT